MKKFRNVSGAPQDLEGGRMIYPGDPPTAFTEEELKSEYNQSKIDAGLFIEDATVQQQEPTKEQLYQRATELEVEGRSSMDKTELHQAVVEAEAEYNEKLKNDDNQEDDG